MSKSHTTAPVAHAPAPHALAPHVPAPTAASHAPAPAPVPAPQYFIPYIGITQQKPTAVPYSKNTCANNAKCVGYSTDGNGFDSNVFSQQGHSKLVFYPSNTQGTYLKNMNEYTVACQYVGGAMDAQHNCELTQAQAQKAVSNHNAVAVSHFSGDMSDNTFAVQMLKSILVIGLLIFLIRCINRMK